jgi:homopolymeric O-antigen transport system ATP-binding protein
VAEIILESVSVSFPLYELRRRSLRHELVRISVGGRISRDSRDHIVVNALEEVSLSIGEGNRVGLVGHNGAGKSTILRVIAGIYEPVSGRVRVTGSVAPLFDMTLGMDPEMTGYENIRLRGLMLGMTTNEIARQFDDIASFSDLGEYLHMPIRTYSTGMMIRLAFAISTSIEPDILVMDEMIGAGDAAFLKRAQERLKTFIDRARILVVASHSEQVLREMCDRAVLLHHGRIEKEGPVDDVLRRYQEISQQGS